jgi:hypothetical protein
MKIHHNSEDGLTADIQFMNIHDCVGEAAETKPASQATKPPSASVGLPQDRFNIFQNHCFTEDLSPTV